jgi:hypothetical protein
MNVVEQVIEPIQHVSKSLVSVEDYDVDET